MSVKAFTLDGLTKSAGEATRVIKLKDLEPNHDFVVITQDETEYDITVLEPQTRRVRVKGGSFTEPTNCKLTGSTLGGSMLWVGRIVVGMRVEFLWNGKTITTSPVKIIGWRIESMVTDSKTIN